MKLSEALPACFGHIRYYEQDNILFDKRNVVTFGAANILTQLVMGNRSAAPSHIGFLYGATATPPELVDPSSLIGPNRRRWTMDMLKDVAETNAANIAVAPLAQLPSAKLLPDTDPELYQANTVTFSAHTGMVDQHLFSGAPFADPLDTLSPAYVYQVILFSRYPGNQFHPFAISQLGYAPFVAKTSSRHQAVFWDITFK